MMGLSFDSLVMGFAFGACIGLAAVMGRDYMNRRKVK